MEKPDIEFVQGPFISTRDSLEEAEVAPAASRLTKEKRRSAELPSSFDTSSRSYRAPPNDHGSSYRFPTYSIFSDSSTYSCCIYPAGLQGAPPITNDIHDRPQGPQRFLLIDLSKIFIFIWFSSDPRSQGHFINRRLLSSFPILFFFFVTIFDCLFSSPSLRSLDWMRIFEFSCSFHDRKILLRTPGAAAVLSPTATYGRHRCPYFCARRFDDSLSLSFFASYPLSYCSPIV